MHLWRLEEFERKLRKRQGLSGPSALNSKLGNTPADDAFAKKINKNVVHGKPVVEVSGKAATGPWKKAVPQPKQPKKKNKK